MSKRIKVDPRIYVSEIQFLEKFINQDEALNTSAAKTMFPLLFGIYEKLSAPMPTPANFLPIPHNHNSK